MKQTFMVLTCVAFVLFFLNGVLQATQVGITRAQQMDQYRTEWLERFGEAYPSPGPAECAVRSLSSYLVWKGGKWIFVVRKSSLWVTLGLEALEYMADGITRRSWRCFKDYCKKTTSASVTDFRAKRLITPGLSADDYIGQNYYADCVRWDHPSMMSYNRCNLPCSTPARDGEISEIRLFESGGGLGD